MRSCRHAKAPTDAIGQGTLEANATSGCYRDMNLATERDLNDAFAIIPVPVLGDVFIVQSGDIA
jgi:hypothetical protein